MTLEGAANRASRVRADSEGRLTFSVDLGPAHSLEEGTAAELAAEASDAEYFVTRQVRLERSQWKLIGQPRTSGT